MNNNQFEISMSMVTLIIGVILFMLSYFEIDSVALGYQLVSLFLIASSIIYLFLISLPKKKKVVKINDEDMFKKNIVSIDLEPEDLTVDERMVIQALNHNDGKMEQREITELLDNKVKAHRVIASLEEKKLVLKKKDGKTNRIFLR